MVAKSILEIEVSDGAFQAFQAQFERYKEAVAKMPGAWGAVGKAAEGATASFDDLVRAAQITASATASIALAQEKVSAATKSTDHAAESLVRNTGKVASNIKDATVSLIKWTGILGAVGGLLGAGGIWGIDRLAASAAGSRRAAGGLGVTSGENQAFGINYGRFVDPNGFLENLANAKSNYEDRWAFGAMGINDYDKKDAADLAPEVMHRAKKMFDGSDQSQQFADANGLTKLFSMDDLRRLHSMTDAEIDAADKRYQQDKKTLSVQSDTQRAWTDFQSQMQRAGQQIENTFITGLVPLAGPLEHLSQSFTDLVAALLKSPQIKIWMGDIGDGLESLAKYVGTPEFTADVEGFVSGLGRLVKAIEGGVSWLLGLTPGHKKFGAYGPQRPGFGWYGPQLPHTVAAPAAGWREQFSSNNGMMERAARNGLSLAEEQDREKKQVAGWVGSAKVLPKADAIALEHQYAQNVKLPAGFAEALFKLEGGLNPDGSASVSPAGAIGAGQLMPATALGAGVNPYDTQQNISGSVADMQRLYKKYGDTDKAAAAYNWGEGNLYNDINGYTDKNGVYHPARGDKWREGLPPETKKYLANLQKLFTPRGALGSVDENSDLGRDILSKHGMPDPSDNIGSTGVSSDIGQAILDKHGIQSQLRDMLPRGQGGDATGSSAPPARTDSDQTVKRFGDLIAQLRAGTPAAVQINNATGGSAVVTANNAAVQ